jgi:hypothetical protein
MEFIQHLRFEIYIADYYLLLTLVRVNRKS